MSVSTRGQALSAGTVTGVVVDPNNAVIPNATVTITNTVTGYTREVNTGTDGAFRFNDVPFNNYQIFASAPGFASEKENVNVRTSLPISVKIPLTVSGAAATVTVTSSGQDILENVPNAHVDVDTTELKKLPISTPGAGVA
ncbi:MAG TPA: carboxypeptidase-like regulatory domain-containing protein, partial [Terriglobales bacterium]|nr:carboxypeptidase-like regulatory domain-containing protein [Terriglobales bacterium]